MGLLIPQPYLLTLHPYLSGISRPAGTGAPSTDGGTTRDDLERRGEAPLALPPRFADRFARGNPASSRPGPAGPCRPGRAREGLGGGRGGGGCPRTACRSSGARASVVRRGSASWTRPGSGAPWREGGPGGSRTRSGGRAGTAISPRPCQSFSAPRRRISRQNRRCRPSEAGQFDVLMGEVARVRSRLRLVGVPG